MTGTLRTTLLMGLIAMISSIVAAFYFPWPEIENRDAKVGSPLFAFESNRIRYINVTQYESSLQSMQEILLRRKSSQDAWFLPNHADYSAGNVSRIATILTNLEESQALEAVSSNQEDFAKYGVIDPDESSTTPNKSFLGRKVTLKDNNREILASLIIGKSPEDTSKKGQAYVRIAGQPSVYLIEIPQNLVSTRFRDWVDPNLLQLGSEGESPARILIDNFRINTMVDTKSRSREDFYRATLEILDARIAIRSLEISEDEKLVKVSPTNEQMIALQTNLGLLGRLDFDDVSANTPAMAEALKQPLEEAQNAFAGLDEFGYFPGQDSDIPKDMTSAGGVIEVTTNSHVVLRMLFGNVLPSSVTESKFSRNLIIVAVPDYEALAKPAEPKPADGSELTEDEKRKHAQAVEAWNAVVKRAENIANGFNQVHCNWIYAIDEGIAAALRPELLDLKNEPKVNSPGAVTSKTVEPNDEKKD